MKQYDVAVIGGGVLGCFTARNLMRWNISAVLLEAEDDICTGITRANTAIVYAGYDNKPGSLKAEMTVRGNANMAALCEELDVPFSRCGSLLVSCGEKGDRVIRKKLEQGQANGVPGLEMLSGEEAQKREPMLSSGVTSALYAPSTGTVNPWQLGIAAYENAVQNGCSAVMNTRVQDIHQTEGGYIVETDKDTYFCRMIVNCAGIHANQIQEMIFPVSVQLKLDGTDFLIMDKRAPKPELIIFHESENGKGITAVPCVEGNLLLDSPARPLGRPFASTREGMDFIRETVRNVLPGVDLTQVIRDFGAVRPNPKRSDGKNLPDFCIEEPAAGFISFIGIKTPGLTCADELGRYAAEKCAYYLGAQVNPHFSPHRKAIEKRKEDPDYYEIVCQCEHITRGEVLEAITRGATTVDGVKRRTGSGMGRCQGSRCAWEIAKILKETGANPEPLF